MSFEPNQKRFRIAFSFAGEKRDFVAATAQILAQRFGEKEILYDKFHEAEFANPDLAFELPSLYKNQADLIVAVFCHDYQQKEWCGLEWRAIFSLIKEHQGKRILLSRFETVEVEDLNGLAGFIDLDHKRPEQFSTQILERLALNEGKPKDHYLKDDTKDNVQVSFLANQYDEEHKNLAEELLLLAPQFFKKMQQAFLKYFPADSIPASPYDIVEFFWTCVPEQVQKLFYLVRLALKNLQKDVMDISMVEQTCEAASAMYCLAAIRLVNSAIHEPDKKVLQVPLSENVICAIIATALFGGKLRLQPSEQKHLPRLECVFEIYVPASGDHIQLGFERALYTLLFENAKDAVIKALDNQPLSEDELVSLESRLDDIKNVDNHCLALIIHGYASEDATRPFAEKYDIPVMFPSNQATELLIGMKAKRLREEIITLWKIINNMRSTGVNSGNSNKSGTENMTHSGININAQGGTVVLSTGPNSAAQVGNNNHAHTGQQQFADLTSLTAKLNELQAAIAELSSLKAKDTFTNHLQTAQSEMTNKEKLDVGIVKQSLEAIKLGSEAIDGGEKIVELCSKALPLLNLLPGIF